MVTIHHEMASTTIGNTKIELQKYAATLVEYMKSQENDQKPNGSSLVCGTSTDYISRKTGIYLIVSAAAV